MRKTYKFNGTVQLKEYKAKLIAEYREDLDGELELFEHTLEMVNDIDTMYLNPMFVERIEREVIEHLLCERIAIEEVVNDDHN